ncbi:hypothetical protein [Streptomyces violascens]|uniref:Uncharacterized protein n=1 Tax=Streptomyces violascens TaxID=67381 RepID=A0ABQ3QEY1_9ACTN|nr:hypothetical protein [Streptomyces violascens]GGU46766.1 hypothetical protein GCM10010289_79080 [Streptomyces violascens]GHI35826.1 hypothetical protein Sviol_02340 [Streptomyces violascens]
MHLCRAPLGAVGIRAEASGAAVVGEPLPDRLVERGGVPGRGQGAGLGEVRAGRGEFSANWASAVSHTIPSASNSSACSPLICPARSAGC